VSSKTLPFRPVVIATADESKRTKRKPIKSNKMTTQISFKVQLKGTFTREGFIASSTGKTMTITKFTDGTFVAKFGNKIFKDRFREHSFLTESVKSLGIIL
jgi:hypothetical protein